MGRAEAMAAYLALAAQCPGFGAARYDVLEPLFSIQWQRGGPMVSLKLEGSESLRLSLPIFYPGVQLLILFGFIFVLLTALGLKWREA